MIEHDKQCKVCVALLARKLQKEESTQQSFAGFVCYMTITLEGAVVSGGVMEEFITVSGHPYQQLHTRDNLEV